MLGTGAKVALLNLYVLACVLPWQSAGGWARAGVVVGGLAIYLVALTLGSRPAVERVFGAVGIYLLAAASRPWPAWSWLVLLGSATAALLLGLLPQPGLPSLGGADGMVDPARSGTPAPPRWRRRMAVTRALAVSGAGGGIVLLLGANLAELGIPGRPPATAMLLTGATGVLALFALRQFFWLPALEHIAEDAGVRAAIARGKGRSRGNRWLRFALFCGLALLGLMLTLRGGG